MYINQGELIALYIISALAICGLIAFIALLIANFRIRKRAAVTETIVAETETLVPKTRERVFGTYKGSPYTLSINCFDNTYMESRVTKGATFDGRTFAATDVGTYELTVSLKDGYTWSAGGRDPLVYTIAIAKAPNNWTVEPNIKSWIMGQESAEPAGKAEFGKVEFEYAQEQNGVYSSNKPAKAGKYWMRASVRETVNYDGLTATATPFEIQNAEAEKPAPAPQKEVQPAPQRTAKPAPVKEKVIEKTKIVVMTDEEAVESGRLRYDWSCTARLIQTDDETKHRYTVLKNDLLAYKGVKDRMSWKRETFRCNGEVLARFSFRGKTLCLYLPLEPKKYVGLEEYQMEDVSVNATYVDTPCMMRIKSDRKMHQAMQLISTVMARLNVIKTAREALDYYVPYEGLLQLINKGLVKRIIRSAQEEAIFLRNAENK